MIRYSLRSPPFPYNAIISLSSLRFYLPPSKIQCGHDLGGSSKSTNPLNQLLPLTPINTRPHTHVRHSTAIPVHSHTPPPRSQIFRPGTNLSALRKHPVHPSIRPGRLSRISGSASSPPTRSSKTRAAAHAGVGEKERFLSSLRPSLPPGRGYVTTSFSDYEFFMLRFVSGWSWSR